MGSRAFIQDEVVHFFCFSDAIGMTRSEIEKDGQEKNLQVLGPCVLQQETGLRTILFRRSIHRLIPPGAAARLLPQ